MNLQIMPAYSVIEVSIHPYTFGFLNNCVRIKPFIQAIPAQIFIASSSLPVLFTIIPTIIAPENVAIKKRVIANPGSELS